MENIFLNNENIIKKFKEKIFLLDQDKGSVIFIDGGRGLGKTHILKELNRIIEHDKIVSSYVRINPPLANYAISNLSPYYPFTKAIDELSAQRNIDPTKKLAMNVGLTLLASLPIAGDFFYAAKEIRRDLKDFKKDQIAKSFSTASSFLEIFTTYSKKQKFVLFFDDFHFADIQSFELLKMLMQKINDISAIFIFTFDSSNTSRQFFSFGNFFKFYKENESLADYFKLEPFNKDLIIEAISHIFPHSKVNDEFVSWLMLKSFGTPLAIFEYLKYFKENNINITNIDVADIDSFVPQSLQSIFLSEIEKLTEEEKNILSICASEGKEFSVFIVSQLLNTDVLNTIRKLRAIQNKSGIISSLGVKNRYGEKTTVYQFNQIAFHTVFENYLEYEEYKSLHTIIASILQKNFEQSKDIAIKNELLPFIVSHSSISGDEELIKKVLKEQAIVAEEYHDTAYINGITHFLHEINNPQNAEGDFLQISNNYLPGYFEESSDNTFDFVEKNNSEATENLINSHINPENILTHSNLQNFDEIIDLTLNKNSDESINIIEQFANLSDNEYEKIKANLLLVKLYSEKDKLNDAVELLNKINFKVNEIDPCELDVLYLNTVAIINFKKGEVETAIEQLKKASKFALKLDITYKLLTVSNISILLKEFDYSMANQYKLTVAKLASDLNYNKFLEDYLARFDNKI